MAFLNDITKTPHNFYNINDIRPNNRMFVTKIHYLTPFDYVSVLRKIIIVSVTIIVKNSIFYPPLCSCILRKCAFEMLLKSCPYLKE